MVKPLQDPKARPAIREIRSVRFEQARTRIIERAANLFAEKRYDQVTLDDLIRILGIGKGTLYRYFTNKEALYSQILDLGHEHLQEILRGVRDRKDIGPIEKLQEMARSMTRYIRLHQDIFRVMAIEEPKERCLKSEKIHLQRRERLSMIEAAVDQGVRQGVFRSDIDTWLFSQSLVSALWADSLFPSLPPDPEGRPVQRIQEIVNLFLTGALTPKSPIPLSRGGKA